MLRRILKNKTLSIKKRIQRLIEYYRIFRGSKILWRNRYRRLVLLYPYLNLPEDRLIERAHSRYWKPFHHHINLTTLRVCKHISGISNPKYIPEEIFVTDIEPTLNQTSSVEYLTYKSFYNHWFPGSIFPQDYFHNIDGAWFDGSLTPIDYNAIKTIAAELDYPVVFKPNKDTGGGKDIHFPENNNQLIDLIENKKNFLVQEKIRQHTFFDQFNHQGINTLRVNLYRSVIDNKLNIINIVLRMGVGGSLDNETAGGVVSLVKSDGFLNGFAVDKYGKKYTKHPDTEVLFDKQIPEFDIVKNTSISIAQRCFFARLVALDLCYDANGRWRMIEVNINGSTIRFAQYHGTLFFDEFTDEVYEYCLQNHWSLH